MSQRKLVGSAEFATALKQADNPTARILTAWSNIPLLLLRDDDWAREPLVMIGLSDYMMWPLLPPGTLLRLNKKVRTIADGKWSEFERPVYLIEHNSKFYCCHAQRKEHSLLLISHAESPCPPSISIPSSEASVRGRLTPIFRALATRDSASEANRKRRLNT